MRLREYTDAIPKPMIPVGQRPILWSIMKYYAHFGHKDFILCLGYRADVIKNYFLSYNEAISNDFVLQANGNKVTLLGSDIQDWRITFADSGLKSNIGERLVAVRKYLDDDDYFMATYADGLTDMPLHKAEDHAIKHGKIANFVAVRPSQSFDVVRFKEDGDGMVESIEHITKAGIWINGGYFTFKKEIFNYIEPGEDLVYKPFQRLMAENQLLGYKYDGFFVSMDTFKEKQAIDDLHASGNAPWEVWNRRDPLSKAAGKGTREEPGIRTD